jgi:hypothetical protein
MARNFKLDKCLAKMFWGQHVLPCLAIVFWACFGHVWPIFERAWSLKLAFKQTNKTYFMYY